MTDLATAMFAAIGFIFMVGASGAAFVFGVATVCRWMEWAPLNITVNLNNDVRGSSSERR